MEHLEIININGKPAVELSEKILEAVGWKEGDTLNITKEGQTLHFTKVLINDN